MNKTIRVGLIRCDTHGMWYGAQMMHHDPVRFERPLPVEDEKDAKYSWMTRGGHFYFYTHYSMPRKMTARHVEGFEIVKLWDEDRQAAELASEIYYGKPIVCDSFEQVSDDVDLVFIADCNGDGSDHLKLARPGLEKGVATFIDKPFASNYKDALAIQELARQNNAPVMSLSILQTNPETSRIKTRLDEVGGVDFGAVTAFNTHPATLIHGISIAHHIFGTGIQAVSAMVTPKHTSFHLDYGSASKDGNRPEHGVVIQCGVSPFRFSQMFVSAYGPKGAIQGRAMNDFDASEGSAIILEHIRDMVQTRTPHVLGNEMLEAIAVMDAAKQAEATGQTVRVLGE